MLIPARMLKTRLVLLLFTGTFLLLISTTFLPAETLKQYTVSGKVTDKSNGEALPGATVFIRELKTGGVTDLYGNYSLTLHEGSYTLVFSYIGYMTREIRVELTANRSLMVELSPHQQELKEVEITSERNDRNVVKPEMSTFRMDIKTIRKIPALMGEVDVIKAIQLLPGVQSVGEGSSGFSVRGGSPDQNLILLDEATVYNASHLMGFFSVFNNDAIRDVKLYKGDIPDE